VDFVSYPIADYLRLLAKGNGNIIENLFEPKLYQNERLVNELQKIILESLHKGILKHYLGYSVSLKKDMENPSRLQRYGLDKLILCRYRVLLAGLLVEKRKEIIYNLNEQHKFIKTDFCSDILTHYLLHSDASKPLLTNAQEELEKLCDALKRVITQSTLPSSFPTIQLEQF